MIKVIKMNNPTEEAINELNRLIDKYLVVQYEKMTEEEKQNLVTGV